MGLVDERFGRRAVEVRGVDIELHRESEPAARDLADAHRCGDLGIGDVEFVLPGHELEGRVEAPPVPPISFGMRTSKSNKPSSERVCPLRPSPVACAVAV